VASIEARQPLAAGPRADVRLVPASIDMGFPPAAPRSHTAEGFPGKAHRSYPSPSPPAPPSAILRQVAPKETGDPNKAFLANVWQMGATWMVTPERSEQIADIDPTPMQTSAASALPDLRFASMSFLLAFVS
jgi:hypothetical protein